jgi:hypothetical protein
MTTLIKIENAQAGAAAFADLENNLCIFVDSATQFVTKVDSGDPQLNGLSGINFVAHHLGSRINPTVGVSFVSKVRMGMAILNNYIGHYVLLQSARGAYINVIYRIMAEPAANQPAANNFEPGMGPGMGGRYRRSHQSRRSHRSRRSRKY